MKTIDAKMDPTSDQYKELVAELLRRLDPTKRVGNQLCDAIMRMWPTPAFEATTFRVGSNKGLEIYLRRRAMDDTAYPGEWHVPGSLYCHGEQDRDVANRLEGEFGVPIRGFELVGREITPEIRGTVHSLIFRVRLDSDPRIDDRHNWFPINDLPRAVVDIHRKFIIPCAAHAFRQRHLRR